jgi:tight adherence protein C
MLEGLSLLIFISIAGVTALVASRLGRGRTQAIERIASGTSAQTDWLPSKLVWRELVARIGSFVPASPKTLPLLKRRLVRAGFRNPNAFRFFIGFRVVGAMVFTLGGLVVGLRAGSDNLVLALGAGALLGFMAPAQYLSARIRRRKRAIEKGLPNALDLMVVCVESGLGMDQTTLQVARELQQAHPEICDEFAVMNLEMRAGKGRAEALHNLAARTGVEDLKKLVAVLVQTDRFGTSIAASLRAHAEYMRTMAHQRAEEQASKLPVKLVFPIFFCVLPSLFVVTLGPVITQLIRELIPMIENM